MTTPTTCEATGLRRRARAKDVVARFNNVWLTDGEWATIEEAVAQALAQESAREALAWETLIKSARPSG